MRLVIVVRSADRVSGSQTERTDPLVNVESPAITPELALNIVARLGESDCDIVVYRPAIWDHEHPTAIIELRSRTGRPLERSGRVRSLIDEELERAGVSVPALRTD